MGRRVHGRRNDDPTWVKVKTYFKKGQQLTVSVTVDECQATPAMIDSLCADAEDTFWRVLEESCRAAGHRLRVRSLSPSHPFIRYAAELDRWVPVRAV